MLNHRSDFGESPANFDFQDNTFNFEPMPIEEEEEEGPLFGGPDDLDPDRDAPGTLKLSNHLLPPQHDSYDIFDSKKQDIVNDLLKEDGNSDIGMDINKMEDDFDDIEEDHTNLLSGCHQPSSKKFINTSERSKRSKHRMKSHTYIGTGTPIKRCSTHAGPPIRRAFSSYQRSPCSSNKNINKPKPRLTGLRSFRKAIFAFSNDKDCTPDPQYHNKFKCEMIQSKRLLTWDKKTFWDKF